MISASSLPIAQGPAPAGFAAFLATIGQVSGDGGESGGFGQLLAAAPATSPTHTVPAAPAMPVAVPAMPITSAASAPAAIYPAVSAPAAPIKIEQLPPADGAAPQVVAVSVEPAALVETPVAKPQPGAADAAAVLAANLLIALNGSRPGVAPAADKPVRTETGADTETDAARSTADGGASAGPANAIPVAILTIPDMPAKTAVRIAGKPANSVEAAALPPTDTAPIQLREAPPRPPLVATGAETPAAKPVEAAAPAMTILFAQPAAQGAAALVDAAAPVPIAERILDLDSDGAWIDQLARDIAATKSDGGDISFRLMPRHLGRLDVAMQMGDAGVSLKLDTQHEATATIVTAAQGRLVEDLRQQGVRVSGAEVTCTPGDAGRQSPSQGQGRAASPDPAHLIETASERAEPRPKTDSEDRARDRRGRFA